MKFEKAKEWIYNSTILGTDCNVSLRPFDWQTDKKKIIRQMDTLNHPNSVVQCIYNFIDNKCRRHNIFQCLEHPLSWTLLL